LIEQDKAADVGKFSVMFQLQFRSEEIKVGIGFLGVAWVGKFVLGSKESCTGERDSENPARDEAESCLHSQSHRQA
jgi:hypothetical protein